MPIMHLLAGPNGSGKSTYAERVLLPSTHLPFINADVIAKTTWPAAQAEHAYEAAAAAATQRAELLANGKSFITETVFSHVSKLELIRETIAHDFLVHLHVMLIPLDLAVHRVPERVERGGHAVPEHKIRERYVRLWRFVAPAARLAHRAEFFDNSSAHAPFKRIARLEHGTLIDEARWPVWAPRELKQLN